MTPVRQQICNEVAHKCVMDMKGQLSDHLTNHVWWRVSHDVWQQLPQVQARVKYWIHEIHGIS